MRTTAIVNQKGGVGKTATTLNLAGALTEAGARVLLVDLDPQGHLTSALGLPTMPTGPGSLSEALASDTNPAPAPVPVTHGISGTPGMAGRLDVITTNVEMFLVPQKLVLMRASERRLGRHLRRFDGDYDHCLIDCPPTLDTLTDNALYAADGVVVPVQAEDSSLHALKLLLGQVSSIEEELRTEPLQLHGLVVSMLERGAGGQARSNVGRSVMAEFEALDLPILATIPRNVVVAEAWRAGVPVVVYAPESELAHLYRKLAAALPVGAP